jgi:hypothetical protein
MKKAMETETLLILILMAALFIILMYIIFKRILNV